VRTQLMLALIFGRGLIIQFLATVRRSVVSIKMYSLSKAPQAFTMMSPTPPSYKKKSL